MVVRSCNLVGCDLNEKSNCEESDSGDGFHKYSDRRQEVINEIIGTNSSKEVNVRQSHTSQSIHRVISSIAHKSDLKKQNTTVKATMERINIGASRSIRALS